MQQVDDLIQCLECGAWFRSLAGHTVAAHGMSTDEYKVEHGLPLSKGLDGSDTHVRRQDAAMRVMVEDPERMRRLWQFLSEQESGAETPSADSLVDFWKDRLASCGWDSWEDAAAWALRENVGWAAVAERMAVTENPVLVRAKEAGVTLPNVLTPAQLDKLKAARAHVARRGSLADPGDELHTFLRHARNHRRRGTSSRIYAELDRIDPGWRTPAPKPAPKICEDEECDQPQAALGLCRIHYQRRRSRLKREASHGVEDTVECLECGKEFRSLGRHLGKVHGLTAADYRARHGLGRSASLQAEGLAEVRRASAREIGLLEIQQSNTERARARWAEAFAAVGWASWQDAADWAMSENQGWDGVAARLGMSKKQTVRHAMEAGVRLLPRLTDKQMQMLAYARQLIADGGTLDGAPDRAFVVWLRGVRNDRHRRDNASRLYLELDRVEPGWFG